MMIKCIYKSLTNAGKLYLGKGLKIYIIIIITPNTVDTDHEDNNMGKCKYKRYTRKQLETNTVDQNV